MAVFLAHWDNKAENQRLVCLDREPSGPTRERCAESLALVQDLGATFGPRKVNLDAWRHTRIWSDRASCQVSMESMPHAGGTFPPRPHLGGGTAIPGGRGSARSHGQRSARSSRERDSRSTTVEDVEAWVTAFEDKVREISAGPPCPGR